MAFERFGMGARVAVIQARDVARRIGDDRIGPEHLLVALLEQPDSVTATVLGRHGITAETAYTEIKKPGDLDAEALEAIGIDLEAVRGKLEEAFGEGVLDPPAKARKGGRLPFTPAAKKALELALREAIALKHNGITDGHLTLGLMRGGDPVTTRILAGADPKELRAQITAELG